jgi:hypothetical protein
MGDQRMSGWQFVSIESEGRCSRFGGGLSFVP